MSELSAPAQPPPAAIVSIPALAAALRAWQRGAGVAPVTAALEPWRLAPMYRLPAGAVAQEADAAAQLAAEVAERLRRLARAYGEWRLFEPGPYFDLTPAQVATLTRVTERVATVRVIVYLDALLPAFRTVATFAASTPAHMGSAEHSDMVYTTLTAHWERMLEVVHGARRRLHDNISFLAHNGAAEEQERWREAPRSGPGKTAGPWWATDWHAAPTLTLSIEFPLPAYRQPGRTRRLRRTWQRRYRLPMTVDGDGGR